MSNARQFIFNLEQAIIDRGYTVGKRPVPVRLVDCTIVDVRTVDIKGEPHARFCIRQMSTGLMFTVDLPL